jgi:hypothetical protein
MRKDKGLNALSTLLHGIADLLADESARNPEFAARVEQLLTRVATSVFSIPSLKSVLDKYALSERAAIAHASAPSPEAVVDIYAQWAEFGESKFRAWLRHVPVPGLRSLIRTHGFDPARRTTRWNDVDKLADFIADALRARLARGAAFMDRGKQE